MSNPIKLLKWFFFDQFMLYIDEGESAPAQPTGKETQITDLPEWKRKYAKGVLAQGAALTDISQNPYKEYEGNRIADFSPMQYQAFQGAANMQPSKQLGTATDLARAAGMGALGTKYQAGQFSNQFKAPERYKDTKFTYDKVNPFSQKGGSMSAAQMMGPDDVSGFGGGTTAAFTNSFTDPGMASSYMNPYTQNVVDIQQREAQRQADIAGTQRNAQAVGAGAFGGSRQAIMNAEAARNLAQQKGDIQARGQQDAYQQAMQQFNAEQGYGLTAQQANLQAGLQSALANQQTGYNVGAQNLSAQQQANVQNLAAKLQTQGLNAEQAMRAALANQQMGMTAQQQSEQSKQFGYGQLMNAAQQRAQYGQAAQQLGEQSRQYGAGLGMQGLQTALQGAGQLGQLGGQQFQQGMDINKLQNVYGGQMQQQAQRPLDMAYQNFQNQQNYPYKQLGFMSDLVNSQPSGQQSTKNIYESPGSFLGQAAGLGMGAYGLSQMGMKFADGGEVKTYAGNRGSVTSQDNKEALIDDTYSIKALMQAKEAALARRDVDTANAIDERIAQLNAIQAQSASINSGLGSAFNQIPEERQEEMMAGGGIVAFADRGAVDVEAIQREKDRAALGQAYEDFKKGAGKAGAAAMDIGTLPFRAIAGAGESVITRPLRALGVDIPYLPESYYGGDASSMTPYMDKLRKEEGYTTGLMDPFNSPKKKSSITNKPQPKGAGARSTPAFIAKDAPKEKDVPKQKKLSPTIDKAITEMAEKQGVPKEDFMDMYDKVRGKLQAESKEDLKGLQDLIDKQSGKSKEIKDKALGKALAEFGFNMAAQASKKGREGYGRGFAGLLGSAAAAGPTLAASVAESQKLAAAADDNDMKLQIEMRKFNIATRKNDSATAMSAAQNMRILQQQQETIQQQQRQLNETIRANKAKEGLLGQQIAARSGTSGLRGMQYVARSRAEAMKLAQKEVDSKIKGGMGFVKPEDYDRMLNQAIKKYLPITTGFGMTGVSSSKDDDDIIDLD